LLGVPEGIIAKLTGHNSRALRRYEHLSPVVRRQTAELIAQVLFTDPGTDTSSRKASKTPHKAKAGMKAAGQ
jgi:hypothetical protein